MGLWRVFCGVTQRILRCGGVHIKCSPCRPNDVCFLYNVVAPYKMGFVVVVCRGAERCDCAGP